MSISASCGGFTGYAQFEGVTRDLCKFHKVVVSFLHPIMLPTAFQIVLHTSQIFFGGIFNFLVGFIVFSSPALTLCSYSAGKVQGCRVVGFSRVVGLKGIWLQGVGLKVIGI